MQINGYAYRFDEKAPSWRTSSDECWETICATVEVTRRRGERTIDGAQCVVYVGADDCLYAITAVAAQAMEAQKTEESSAMEHEDRLEAMLDSYIETALWSSTDDNGKALDAEHSADDLSADAKETMRRDCVEFLRASDAAVLEAADIDGKSVCEDTAETWARFGHDFWLTRNRHGAGFWDRPEVWGVQLAKILTTAAHTRGSCDLVLDSDGTIHVG